MQRLSGIQKIHFHSGDHQQIFFEMLLLRQLTVIGQGQKIIPRLPVKGDHLFRAAPSVAASSVAVGVSAIKRFVIPEKFHLHSSSAAEGSQSIIDRRALKSKAAPFFKTFPAQNGQKKNIAYAFPCFFVFFLG